MSEKEYVKIIEAMDNFLGVAKGIVDAHEGEDVKDGIDSSFYDLLMEIMEAQIVFKKMELQ